MKKRITTIIVVSALIALICTCIFIYKYNYPTYYGFKDRLILGSTFDEITLMYGEPDISNQKYGSSTPPSWMGYLVKPSRPTWWDKTWPEYYYIRFDKNGIAYKIEVIEWRFGG